MKKIFTIQLIASVLSFGAFAQTPAPITGSTSDCPRGMTSLYDATPGGTWYSSNITVATVDTFAGTVYSISAGTTTISYTVGSSSAVTTFTVFGSNTILGPTTVCVGSSITLTDSVSGGTWWGSGTTIATINATTGVLTGISAGTYSVDYSAPTGSCGVAGPFIVTVTTSSTAGTISGPSSVVVGSGISLSDGVSGGSWSSSNTSIASVDPFTGYVTGIAAGTVTISYTLAGCSGVVSATYPITVVPLNSISGTVNFTGSPYSGALKIWLIKYDPATFMLTAVDSVSAICSLSTYYRYQFLGATSDSFRVKAAIDSAVITTTGYLPTYHPSDFYWHTATAFYHIAGTADINKDITMLAGRPTSGPGFIGGSVLTGANRGTTGGIPVVGLSMNLLDASSHLLQTTRTNAAGNYSFSNLPVGATYFVFPDSLNYLTTPYTGISLTSSAASMNTASFIQHTVSHTITRIGTLVGNVSATDAAVVAYPNPSNGKLSISWKEPVAETGSVTITDAAGREAYHTPIELTKGNGMKMIDLSNLADGLYLINIKSANINYNNKLQIQH
jgi:hypothetical protein